MLAKPGGRDEHPRGAAPLGTPPVRGPSNQLFSIRFAASVFRFQAAVVDYNSWRRFPRSSKPDTATVGYAANAATIRPNLGGGKFTDVTARAGVGDPGFSTSAVWFDYDNDGKLDLFVANYVDWTVETDQFCSLDGKNKSYCTPQSYKGQSSTLYHNKGNGSFENVTQRAGLVNPTSKSLGVALLAYNNDGC